MPNQIIANQPQINSAQQGALDTELFADGQSAYARLNRMDVSLKRLAEGLRINQAPQVSPAIHPTDSVQISDLARAMVQKMRTGSDATSMKAIDMQGELRNFARMQAMQQAASAQVAVTQGAVPLSLFANGPVSTAGAAPNQQAGAVPASGPGGAAAAASAGADPAQPETAAPAVAASANLGSIAITDIQAVTDQAGNVTGATGKVDLSNFGLGTLEVDLVLDDNNKVVGANLSRDQLTVNAGGNDITFAAQAGKDVLSIDAAGNVAFSGTATVNLGGIEMQLGNATASAGRDAQGNATFSMQATYMNNDVSMTFNSSGQMSAEFASGGLTDFIPGLDKVTDFLDRVGVELDSGAGASISFDKNTGTFAVDANGITGSFNQSTGEFSIGGLEIGAGVSIGLENLTINTKTGSASASITAGVGVEAGGIGIGVDLAGFDFNYDANTGDITLTGTQGIAAANLQVTAVLGRGDNGNYGVKSVDFKANIDDALARDVAAGLNQAYKQGTALGNQAITELGRAQAQGAAAVRNLARGLQSAGDNTKRMLDQAGKLAGSELKDFLSTTAAAGNNLGKFLDQAARVGRADMGNFLSAAANSGHELGTLLSTAGKLGGSNLSNFLHAAAGRGSGAGAFIKKFSSLLTDVNKVSGGVANLTVSRTGGISGSINVPGAGSMSVSFGRSGSSLTAKGSLNLGGFAFTNAEVTFGSNGAVSSVTGGATISTPTFKVLGHKVGSQKIGFTLGFKNGSVFAKGSLSVNLGWLGRHGADFTLGKGGFSTRVF